uniref:RAB11 family interacting protein 5 n=1 Tax=Varanus komodoensis TaxID=61221 RepID=A0A8D2IWD2_VARKO
MGEGAARLGPVLPRLASPGQRRSAAFRSVACPGGSGACVSSPPVSARRWYKLHSKPGKKEKDRGEVQLSIQFTRHSLTASMFDLSVKEKPRSPFGRLKDKVTGRQKYDLESASAIVPSSSGALDEELGPAGKKAKAKSFFFRSKLRKSSLTQSNTSLGSDSTASSASSVAPGGMPQSPSRHSSLSTDPSGKRGRDFLPSPKLTHKRAFSDEASQIGLLPDARRAQGLTPQSEPVSRSSLCINGSHIYCEEPAPRPAGLPPAQSSAHRPSQASVPGPSTPGTGAAGGRGKALLATFGGARWPQSPAPSPRFCLLCLPRALSSHSGLSKASLPQNAPGWLPCVMHMGGAAQGGSCRPGWGGGQVPSLSHPLKAERASRAAPAAGCPWPRPPPAAAPSPLPPRCTGQPPGPPQHTPLLRPLRVLNHFPAHSLCSSPPSLLAPTESAADAPSPEDRGPCPFVRAGERPAGPAPRRPSCPEAPARAPPEWDDSFDAFASSRLRPDAPREPPAPPPTAALAEDPAPRDDPGGPGPAEAMAKPQGSGGVARTGEEPRPGSPHLPDSLPEGGQSPPGDAPLPAGAAPESTATRGRPTWVQHPGEEQACWGPCGEAAGAWAAEPGQSSERGAAATPAVLGWAQEDRRDWCASPLVENAFSPEEPGLPAEAPGRDELGGPREGPLLLGSGQGPGGEVEEPPSAGLGHGDAAERLGLPPPTGGPHMGMGPSQALEGSPRHEGQGTEEEGHVASEAREPSGMGAHSTGPPPPKPPRRFTPLSFEEDAGEALGWPGGTSGQEAQGLEAPQLDSPGEEAPPPAAPTSLALRAIIGAGGGSPWRATEGLRLPTEDDVPSGADELTSPELPPGDTGLSAGEGALGPQPGATELFWAATEELLPSPDRSALPAAASRGPGAEGPGSPLGQPSPAHPWVLAGGMLRPGGEMELSSGWSDDRVEDYKRADFWQAGSGMWGARQEAAPAPGNPFAPHPSPPLALRGLFPELPPAAPSPHGSQPLASSTPFLQAAARPQPFAFTPPAAPPAPGGAPVGSSPAVARPSLALPQPGTEASAPSVLPAESQLAEELQAIAQPLLRAAPWWPSRPPTSARAGPRVTGGLPADWFLCPQEPSAPDPSAKYFHLTHDELIQLLSKREAELRGKQEHIQELENYIDRLLVRIMEQSPTLLQIPLGGEAKAAK